MTWRQRVHLSLISACIAVVLAGVAILSYFSNNPLVTVVALVMATFLGVVAIAVAVGVAFSDRPFVKRTPLEVEMEKRLQLEWRKTKYFKIQLCALILACGLMGACGLFALVGNDQFDEHLPLFLALMIIELSLIPSLMWQRKRRESRVETKSA